MEDDAELNRILTMSEEELRAEFIAEGRDPDEVVASMRRELSAMIELVQERDRLRECVLRLEEGLRPFAAILAKGEPVGPIPRGLLDSKLTRADLRRATALIATSSHQPA